MSRPDYYGNPGGVTSDIEVVRAIYAAFEERDPAAANRFLAEDCELHLTGTASAIGRVGPYLGHAGMREYFADVARVWPDLTLHATDFRAIPGAVVVMGHVEATFEGEPFRRNAVWTWKVENGKATHVRVTGTGPA